MKPPLTSDGAPMPELQPRPAARRFILVLSGLLFAVGHARLERRAGVGRRASRRRAGHVVAQPQPARLGAVHRPARLHAHRLQPCAAGRRRAVLPGPLVRRHGHQVDRGSGRRAAGDLRLVPASRRQGRVADGAAHAGQQPGVHDGRLSADEAAGVPALRQHRHRRQAGGAVDRRQACSRTRSGRSSNAINDYQWYIVGGLFAITFLQSMRKAKRNLPEILDELETPDARRDRPSAGPSSAPAVPTQHDPN